jgi:hypothetical protein
MESSFLTGSLLVGQTAIRAMMLGFVSALNLCLLVPSQSLREILIPVGP